MGCRNGELGFTLLELIATIVMVAILAAYGLANWNQWVANARQRTLINDYHTLFSHARWQAASHRHPVTICPLAADGTCVDDWNLPVHVFPDEDKDRTPDADTIWRTLPQPPSWLTVRSRTGGRGYLRFSGTGIIDGASGGVVLCPAAGKGQLTYLAINMGGRFRAEYDRDGDGVIKLPWGPEISC